MLNVSHGIGVGQALSFWTPSVSRHAPSVCSDTFFNRFDSFLRIAKVSQELLCFHRAVHVVVLVKSLVLDARVVVQQSGDLDDFRRSGAKMITMVGTNDQLIMPRGVINYYRQMASRYDKRRHHRHHRFGFYRHGNDIDFTSVQKFYRLFRAPGVAHCRRGAGPQPQDLFEALVDWVEHGIAPDMILAINTDDAGNVTRSRPLCPYPQTAIYDGIGDPDDASSFYCGGNLETTRTVCNDVLVKYKYEVYGPRDFRGTGVNWFECYNID